MLPNVTRPCTICGVIKPPGEFQRPEPSGKRASRCMACKNADGQRRRAIDPEPSRESVRRYAAAHPDLVRESRQRNLARYPERQKAAAQRYIDANPEKVAARHKRYRAAHVEHYREYGRLYAKTERGRLIKLAIGHRWRARLQGAAGYATATQITARIAYYGGLCWMCGKPATTIDHVIPLARGGTNWPANLRPACLSCNCHKKDRSHKLFC